MKETKIAKENVKEKENSRNKQNKHISHWSCIEHKQTCQRWLEFLEDKPIIMIDKRFESKIKDLKQAIKLYEDAGI